jgi:hypothetical protein
MVSEKNYQSIQHTLNHRVAVVVTGENLIEHEPVESRILYSHTVIDVAVNIGG